MRSLLVKLVIDNMFLDGPGFMPSLSMKKCTYINKFTTKLLSKLLRDLYFKRKFGSKVVNRQFFHRKTVFS